MIGDSSNRIHRSYYAALPLLALLSAAYAVSTQPLMGSDSMTRAATRAMIMIVWLGLFPLALKHRAERWSRLHFCLGCFCGGAWIPLIVTEETIAEALPIIALGTAYGTISGLYAAVARTPAWAVMTGIAVFLAQFLIDFAMAALNLSRISWGM